VAGNLGAKTVQISAGNLEKLIRQRAKAQDLESAKQQVAADLDPLVASLQAALNLSAAETAPQATAQIAVDPAKSREAAAQLIKLLAEFDPGAVDFIEVNQSLLAPLFTMGAWEELKKQAQSYAFQECQAMVEQAVGNS